MRNDRQGIVSYDYGETKGHYRRNYEARTIAIVIQIIGCNVYGIGDKSRWRGRSHRRGVRVSAWCNETFTASLNRRWKILCAVIHLHGKEQLSKFLHEVQTLPKNKNLLDLEKRENLKPIIHPPDNKSYRNRLRGPFTKIPESNGKAAPVGTKSLPRPVPLPPATAMQPPSISLTKICSNTCQPEGYLRHSLAFSRSCRARD